MYGITSAYEQLAAKYRYSVALRQPLTPEQYYEERGKKEALERFTDF